MGVWQRVVKNFYTYVHYSGGEHTVKVNYYLLLFWEDNSRLRLTKAYIADISCKLTLTKYDYRSKC